MVKTRSAAPEGQDFIISSLPPSPAQRRLALGVVLALMAAFVVTAGPLSTVPLPRIDAFIPMYASAMFVNDSITAVLLFAQFSILRSHALLAISSGYLFTALILIPWVLTFPGLFAPGGLLGAGLQSTAWLYFLWHAGFPLFVIAYALLKNADPSKQRWKGARSPAILSSAAVAVAAVCAATFLVTAGHALLPRLMRDPVSAVGSLHQYVAGCTVLVSAVALMVLWIRRGSVLDLWLMVVLCDYVIEISLLMLPAVNRYTLGWYAGRIFGLISASVVLFVLLYEITTLYARLRLLNEELEQRVVQRTTQLMQASEALREAQAELAHINRVTAMGQLAASIGHEVMQPIAAAVTSVSGRPILSHWGRGSGATRGHPCGARQGHPYGATQGRPYGATRRRRDRTSWSHAHGPHTVGRDRLPAHGGGDGWTEEPSDRHSRDSAACAVGRT